MVSTQDFDEDKALIVEEPCCQDTRLSPNKKRIIGFHVVFTLTNIIIACITMYSYANSPSRYVRFPGWDTELQDARNAIEYEERIYTGALTYDYEKQQVVKLNDSDLEFFGPPSSKIDDAWRYLLHGEFTAMTKEEAAPYGPELQPVPRDNKYYFEPDMFHNLHCINAVRMELNQNLYNHSSEATLHHHSFPESVVGPNYETAHLEHCLDRLRQAVMCHGDLTPSPLYVFKGFPVALGKSGKHTCRRFEPIRQWMDKRASTLGVIEGL